MSYTDRHACNHKMKNKSEDRVFKILFPVREKRSSAVSLFPFRQISEFPTGAALLKAAELSRHCRLVYVTYRKVSEGRSFGMPYRKLGGTAVELSSLCTFVQRDFFMSCRKRPRETPECAREHPLCTNSCPQVKAISR